MVEVTNERDEVAGGAEVNIKTNPYGEVYAYISWIAIDESCRGKGIGMKLLYAIEAALRERDIKYTVSGGSRRQSTFNQTA